jgi:hypothetical protein
MRKLEFIGTVQANMPTQEMVFPGRDDLFLAPADWPQQLAQGILIIRINGFPDGFDEIGKGEGLERLDQGEFRAALVIPQRKIIGNTLKPTPEKPTRGFAQVWRAELQVIATGQAAACWMIRIIGSDTTSQIELVADEDLRNRSSFCDGTAVKVTVWEAESKWKPMTPTELIADWCKAARGILDEFGREKAMGYLIGEKLLNFLEVAETGSQWRQAIPAFVAEINGVFEQWQIAEFLNTPRRLGALGQVADEETHRMFREGLDEDERVREDARNLILLEWAKELLLDEEDRGWEP